MSLAPPRCSSFSTPRRATTTPPACTSAWVERLRAEGRHVETFVVGQGHDLAAVIGRAVNAARDARGAVVAAGGDGTLNAVAQAVWNANLPMGVLPQGTFNYFARAHGIPASAGPSTPCCRPTSSR